MAGREFAIADDPTGKRRPEELADVDGHPTGAQFERDRIVRTVRDRRGSEAGCELSSIGGDLNGQRVLSQGDDGCEHGYGAQSRPDQIRINLQVRKCTRDSREQIPDERSGEDKAQVGDEVLASELVALRVDRRVAHLLENGASHERTDVELEVGDVGQETRRRRSEQRGEELLEIEAGDLRVATGRSHAEFEQTDPQTPNNSRCRAATPHALAICFATAGGVFVGVERGRLDRSIHSRGALRSEGATHLQAVGGEVTNILTAMAPGLRSSTMRLASVT